MSLDVINNDPVKVEKAKEISSMLSKEIELSKIDILEVLKDERIKEVSTEVVGQRVEVLSETYGASETEKERVAGYKVVVVPSDLYMRLGYSEMCEDLFENVNSVGDLVKKDMLSTSVLLLKKADGSTGICNSKEKLIVVRDTDDENMLNRTIDHEIIHAMADYEEGKSGFQDDSDEESRDLNEAMVEIMEMMNTFKLNPKELTESLISGKIGLVENRLSDVLPLLALFLIVDGSDEPLSVSELTKHYWKGDVEGFMDKLVEKVDSEKEKGLSGEILQLMSDLYSRIK